MEKKPFVTRSSYDEIVKKRPHTQFTNMMKRGVPREDGEQRQSHLHLPDIGLPRVFCGSGNTESICN
ncbi:MAG: hypothetical protein ACLR8P_02910 [Clostridium fessum]